MENRNQYTRPLDRFYKISITKIKSTYGEVCIIQSFIIPKIVKKNTKTKTKQKFFHLLILIYVQKQVATS